MAMYEFAILLLITRFHYDFWTQKWYADDGSVVGKLKDIRALFDKLTQLVIPPLLMMTLVRTSSQTVCGAPALI